MAEASKLPPDPFAGWVEVVEPDPARWWRPWVGVVLAAGRSQRLVSVTGVALRRCSGWGGLSLVERAVRSLLAAGLERVVVVVGYDAGPVATVVGRLAALAAVTATSALSLGLRVAFLRRPLIA